MLIFLGVLLLISLVILHELGHFWAARKSGVEVEEFGLGFPPKAKTLGSKNGTEYTLNWLPLGGFVKLKGEHDSDTTKGSFGAAKLSNKVYIMLAGVLMNVFAAMAILSFVALFGMPKVLPNQFSVSSDTKIVQQDVIAGLVTEGSPAESAGLKQGDVILNIAPVGCQDSACNNIIETADDMRSTTEALAGQEVNIGFQRRGLEYPQNTKTTLLSIEEVEASRQTDNPKGYLGVVPSEYIEQKSTWSAPIVGVGTTIQFFYETLRGLGNIVSDLFRGNTETAKDNVTGVVGIGYILKELSEQGIISILFLTAIISVSLAVMNILPIPALDGGRLFVTLLFRVLRRPLTKETEERIHGTGFAALMVLFVLITILDVQKFIINK